MRLETNLIALDSISQNSSIDYGDWNTTVRYTLMFICVNVYMLDKVQHIIIFI